MFRIEIEAPDLGAMRQKLAELMAGLQVGARIAPEDRPDVGVQPAPNLAAVAQFAVANLPNPPAQIDWAAAAGVPAMPAPAPVDWNAAAQLPLPPSAPFTAGAAAPSTAPAVSTGGAPLPPGAGFLPVPTTAQIGAVLGGAAQQGSAGTVELDVSGLPWDPRIHSSTRGKVADGFWKKKRGLNDAAYIGKVEGELRHLLTLPLPPAAPAVVSSPPPAWVTPVAPPAPVAMPPAPAPAASGPTTYEELTTALTTALTKDSTVMSRLGPAMAALGVAQVPAFQTRPDLIPAFWRRLMGLQ